jgi:antitoxin (DNA-binding transcriptional repressor) of toxin-antitoxin stability system
MKTIDVQNANLDACVTDAQSAPVVLTRGGNPVAYIVGVQGLDEEQVQLGVSDKFWQMISARRQERSLDRAALEKRLDG